MEICGERTGGRQDESWAQCKLFGEGLMFPNWVKTEGISKSNG